MEESKKQREDSCCLESNSKGNVMVAEKESSILKTSGSCVETVEGTF
jgi:hypothetical protein